MTAPDSSTAVRASAVRAPTAIPCSERSSTSTAYASITMSWEAEPNATKRASIATTATSAEPPKAASPSIPAISTAWQIRIHDRRRPIVPKRGP